MDSDVHYLGPQLFFIDASNCFGSRYEQASCDDNTFEVLERRLRALFIFQRTWSQFSAFNMRQLKLSVTPVPGDPHLLNSVVTCMHIVHTYTHTGTHAHTHKPFKKGSMLEANREAQRQTGNDLTLKN